MFRLLEFIRSTYVVILFVIAETIAISHYAMSDSYARAKIFLFSSSVTGGISGTVRSATHLLSLPQENRALSERIAQLEAEVDHYAMAAVDTLGVDDIIFDDPAYSYVVGRVVSNSINKLDNFIVVDKGVSDGVREQMALITPDGLMLGYVASCSSRYSAALSILSHNFTTSGKLKGGANYGSVSWSGENRYHVQMSELSKYEPISVGDTVVSTGFSNIFPGDVVIGTVASFEFNEMQTAYNVEIELAAQITAINHVLMVGNRESGEIEELLHEAENNFK
ncbi:MAG: rod shape-determining protein MreC [Rikenellaceae bacterium]